MSDGIPVDADARERRQRLERIAFGRTHSRKDEAAAAAARKELVEAAREELAEADRAAQVAAQHLAARELATRQAVADDLSGQGTPPNPDIPPPPPPEPPRMVARRMRPAWLVPIVVASIAVGYYGATIAVAGTLQASVHSTPAPIVPSPVFLSPARTAPPNGGTSVGGPSSLKEADAWFETLPSDSDPVVDPAILANLGIDPSAIRFVQINAAGSQVWVARKLDGDLCVIGTEGEGQPPFTGCTTREAFAGSGITVTLLEGRYSLTWNGSAKDD